uniref:Uncharacterized protein n=1 Tax=Stomoxys calcitrans TaxID=35570 RepID=A0A1I8P429_STOCA|nr:unnamed protein product [Stomoxys calcitrans]
MDSYYTFCFDVLILLIAVFLTKLLMKFVCNLRYTTWVHDSFGLPHYESVIARDRQGNVFTIHDESTRESRYNDIFFIEPNSAEAARIRAQLEKDDKDLPSYEEVMRMTSVTSTTPANTAAMTASNASVNTAETRLSVPPYSEVDPNASSTSLHAVGNATTINSASAATPTTQTQSTPPPPLFAAAVVSSSVTQATLNV